MLVIQIQASSSQSFKTEPQLNVARNLWNTKPNSCTWFLFSFVDPSPDPPDLLGGSGVTSFPSKQAIILQSYEFPLRHTPSPVQEHVDFNLKIIVSSRKRYRIYVCEKSTKSGTPRYLSLYWLQYIFRLFEYLIRGPIKGTNRCRRRSLLPRL